MFFIALLVFLCGYQTCSYGNKSNVGEDPLLAMLSDAELDNTEYYSAGDNFNISLPTETDSNYTAVLKLDDENVVLDNNIPDARSVVPSFTLSKKSPIVCHNKTRQIVLDSSSVQLCGEPGFCNSFVNSSSHSSCYCTTLWNCQQCSRFLVIGGVITIFFLGILILLSNASIVFIMLSNTRSSLSSMKCSLAVADLLTGIVLLASALPNHLLAIKSTEEDILVLGLSRQGSVYTKVFGSILILSVTASVYHLVLMSFERLIVIKYPFIMCNQRKYKIRISLGVVWVWSALVTAIPVFFPNYFGYALNPPTLLSLINVKAMGESITHGIVYLTALLLFPYITAVFLITTTAWLVRKKLWKSRSLKPSMNRSFQSNNRSPVISKKRSNGIRTERLKPEIAVLKTTAIMIFGFTITLVPLACIVALYYAAYVDCSNYSTAYSVCFYLSLSNSFANFIIYNWRDESFRRKLFKRICVSNRRRSSWSYYSGSAAKRSQLRLSQVNSSMNESVLKSNE